MSLVIILTWESQRTTNIGIHWCNGNRQTQVRCPMPIYRFVHIVNRITLATSTTACTDDIERMMMLHVPSSETIMIVALRFNYTFNLYRG